MSMFFMKIYLDETTTAGKKMQVNIWNHDPAWKTDFWVDGVHMGPLSQEEGFDPYAYATLLGPDLPKPRGFAEPRKTEHMFHAVIPSSAKEIKVTATDRFGNKYSAIQKA